MKRSLAGWLLVCFVLAAHCGCDSQNLAGPELVSYEALQRVDGSLTLDDERKHVVAVHFASPRTPRGKLTFTPRGTTASDEDLRHLASFPQLQRLSIRSPRISDTGMAQLAGLERLETLRLPGAITDKGLQHLGRLRVLDLIFTAVTDAGLVHLEGLAHLEQLLLLGTNVPDAGLEHLVGLRNLRHLVLNETRVTDAGVADLQKSLPNCKIEK